MNDASVLSDPEISIGWIGGNCPVQAEGTINGEPFYFRARGERWSMSIGGDDVVGAPDWYHEEDFGETAFAAGWMSESEARGFIEKSARLYLSRPKSEDDGQPD
ncbi:TPA: hypothetical protein O5T86_001262 [Staphylococcus aureus]|nr:hypothetical protein [Staphylococcus aureus]HDA7217719.1 hypothetical protein [Staphylococcus aureus]HDA7234756.1 hypothetical protein [Staphylococcus aureus]HDA7236801.1 hypothetical protein [Staphylococcus aureus]HDA7239226.1 hypothetical protein [Staphylococcus aureus]